MPDGLFSDQNVQFLYIFEGLGMKNFGIFNSHLVFLRLFVMFYGYLEDFVAILCIFSHFGVLL
jgi:hypothetical protein